MELGISTYTYTWAFGIPGSMPLKPWRVDDLMEQATRFGLKRIQVADNFPLSALNINEIELLRTEAYRRQLTMEVGSKLMTEKNLRDYIAIASLFDCTFLRFVIDGPGYEPETPEIISVIRKALPELRKNKLVLALENHDRLKTDEFIELIEKTDPEWIGICLDSVNSMGAAEGIREVVSSLAPYTVNLHIKDFIIRRASHKMGFLIEGVPAGKGMLNIKWLIDQVKQHGKCVSAILELWTPPEKELEETLLKESQWANESLQYLRNIFT